MQVSRSVVIDASPTDVWSVVSDIEHATTRISGIKDIEILEQPTGPSITGLKWRETREFMGRDAVETMWVTEAEAPSYYETRAENPGSIYQSRIEVAATDAGTRLTMAFTGKPIKFGAKVMWALTGWMAKKPMCKTIDQDLADIKGVVEASTD